MACRENLRVVEDEEVLLLEVVENILEDAVLDGTLRAVDDHQPRLVAVLRRIFGQHVGAEVVAVLRKFHDMLRNLTFRRLKQQTISIFLYVEKSFLFQFPRVFS